jgi:peroxiredoxin
VNLNNPDGEAIYAVFEADDRKEIDTFAYEGTEEFVIIRMEEHFRLLTLYFENHRRWVTAYLTPHKPITVTGDVRYPPLIRVKGGRINDMLTGFRGKVSTLLKEQTDLMNAAASSSDPSNEAKYTTRLAGINYELRLRAEAFIEKYPDEEASAVLIGEYLIDPEHPLFAEKFVNLLSPELNDFYVVKDLKNSIEKAKRTIPGVAAPGFETLNIDGKAFGKESFSGRYFILAFVSAWRDKCQTKELQLDRIIASFPKDSLDVMLVALDEDARDVREQIRTDSISWNVVTDSAGEAIRLTDLYNASILPCCYLMDREGVILLKTEHGVALEQELDKRINRKKD